MLRGCVEAFLLRALGALNALCCIPTLPVLTEPLFLITSRLSIVLDVLILGTFGLHEAFLH